MDEWKDIIVTDTLGAIRTDIEKEYLAHMLCLGGTCRYRFNEREFEFARRRSVNYPQTENA